MMGVGSFFEDGRNGAWAAHDAEPRTLWAKTPVVGWGDGGERGVEGGGNND
jgi:hypothetical protein